MSNQLRVFKKGEVIFSEGEKATQLYLVQSGLISVFLPRQKRNVEIFQVSGSQVLGEHALLGSSQHPFSAVAVNETKVLKFPVELVKMQLDQGSQLLQLLVKSMVEKQKSSTNEIKSIRMEKDSAPCPSEQIAKVFGVIFHVARHVGMEKEDRVSVTWSSFRQYAQRVFLLSPFRLENACNILVKLKLAEFEKVKNEKDPEAGEEYGYFHLLDLGAVEKFFEYYQHYYYKGGNLEFFKVDDKLRTLVQLLLDSTECEKVNRAGVVQTSYEGALEKLRKGFGGNFKPDAFERLEKKGLFLKRETGSSGGSLSFYRHDFEVMLRNWRILREIEKWNERGVVSLVDETVSSAKGRKAACPDCETEIQEAQKFCGNCGLKLTESKAAA